MNAHVIHSRQFCRLPKRPEKFRLGRFLRKSATTKNTLVQKQEEWTQIVVYDSSAKEAIRCPFICLFCFSLSILFIVVQLHQSKLNRFPTGSCYFQKWLKQKKRKWFRNTCCRDGKTITLDAFYFNKSANGAFTFGNGLALRLNRNISSSIVLHFV